MVHRARNAQKKGLKAREACNEAKESVHYLRERAEEAADLGWIRPALAWAEEALEVVACCGRDRSESPEVAGGSARSQTSPFTLNSQI